MQFRLTPAPYLRDTRSTLKIMLELSACLAACWLYAIVFNFINLGAVIGVDSILVGVVSIVSSVICDIVCGLITGKKFKELPKYVLHSYSYVTGLIFALCLTPTTSLYVVVLGSIFGTALGKLVFGGFGQNVVNPAGIGRVFVALTFSVGQVTKEMVPGYADYFSGGTVTASINWFTGGIDGKYNLMDLLTGGYVGAMGETCSILLLVCAAFLIYRGVIDFRLFLSYVGTCFVIALALGFVLPQVDFALTYALTHILSGGLLFGAVFMITDPVTTPTSGFGKIIFGIFAAMLTILIRVCGNLPEGVVFSIVIMNFFTPLIEQAIKGKTNQKVVFKAVMLGVFLVVAVLVNVGLALLVA